MRKDEAKVYVTKTAAAQRQLDAAIRMFLKGEDELAVHTLAAAAFRILRDLKGKRGRGTLMEAMGAGLFAVAADLAAGRIHELPEELTGKDLDAAIKEIAERIRRGDVKTSEDIQLGPNWALEKRHWSKFNVPANFLKHSDSDEDKSLLESELQNDMLLVQACVAYRTLMGHWTPEMFVFGQLWNSESNDPVGFELNAFSARLRGINSGQRRQVCLELIKELKRTKGSH